MQEPPEFCANCGAAIPRHAHACPECGADERTGWAESDPSDGLDLPPDEEAVAEDEVNRAKRIQKARFWWVIALLTAVAFGALLLGLR